MFTDGIGTQDPPGQEGGGVVLADMDTVGTDLAGGDRGAGPGVH